MILIGWLSARARTLGLVRGLVPGLILAVFGLGCMSFSAAETRLQSLVSFDIPVKPIEAALILFGEQSKISVVIHNQALGLKSTPIKGEFTPYDALEKLLGDSGLDYRLNAGGVVIFQPIAVVGLGDDSDVASQPIVEETLVETKVSVSPTTLIQSERLEEIIVTAQKREQSVQSLGIAVTSFSGRDIRALGMLRPEDLSAQTPGLDIKNALGALNPIFTLRGVGLNDYNSNNNPSVGVYVDEVYMASSAYLSFQVFDIERVEILKGPQGTLYGRNSTGGAVNFVSAKPGDDFEAYLDIDYGRWNTLKLQGAVSGPINDSVSGRLALQINKSDGYYVNNGTTVTTGLVGTRAQRFDDRGFDVGQPSGAVALPGNPFVARDDDFFAQSNVSVRATLVWDVSETVELSMSLHQVRDESDMLVRSMDVSATDLNGFNPLDDNPFTVDANFGAGGQELDVTGFGGYLKLDADLGFASFTGISGYEGIERLLPFEDSSPWRILDQLFEEDMYEFSQEFRLASIGEKNFHWMVGLYYSEEHLESRKDIVGLDSALRTQIRTQFDQSSESSAVFGQAEWALVEDISITAGLRYTDDQKSYSGGSFIPIEPYGPYGVDLAPTFWDLPLIGSENFGEDNLSTKLSLDWIVRPNLLFYLSWNKGHKSGGFDGSTITQSSSFTPFLAETLYAWETGIKSRWSDGKVQWNFSAFTYDYEDMQAEAQREINVGSGTFESIRANAGEASISGMETDLWIRLTGNVDFKLGFSYLDTKITDWFVDGLDSEIPAVAEVAQDEVLAHIGNKLPDSPEFTISGLARYQRALTDSLTLITMIDFNYVDESFKNIDNDEYLMGKAYWLVNARVSIVSVEENWEVSLWGKNLTDKIYFRERFDNFGSQWVYETPGVPKSYGVSLIYRWD